MPSRPAATALLLAASLAGCGSCDPHEQVRRDKARFPPLSLRRPLGSPCSERDSASVRRAAAHPLHPTGGWNALAEADGTRSPGRELPAGASAVLVAHGQVVSGYVRFAQDGALRARVYDDVYGAVYGGWSPSSLDLKAGERPVFVALGRGAWGDGGLDQVFELCFTPKGAAEGVVVYSSAHSPRAPPLRARDTFRKADLGARGAYLDDRLAVQLLSEMAQDRDLSAAKALLIDARALLGSLPAAVDGSTGRPIPPRLAYLREHVEVASFGVGFAVGTPAFDAEAGDLEALLASRAPKALGCWDCERFEKMLPLYRFVDARARGQDAPLPDPAALPRGVVGYDPQAIARLLGGGTPSKMHEATSHFWSGVQALHAGDAERMKSELTAWLAQPLPPTVSGFELGAAAALLARE